MERRTHEAHTTAVHGECLLTQDLALGGEPHQPRIASIRLGDGLEGWLHDYQTVFTARILNYRAYFRAAVHVKGRPGFIRALLPAPSELAAVLRPLGVERAEGEGVRGGRVVPLRFRV